MKLIVAIVAAAVVDVVAMLVMNNMSNPLTSDSHARFAIAGAVSGLVAVILARKKPEK